MITAILIALWIIGFIALYATQDSWWRWPLEDLITPVCVLWPVGLAVLIGTSPGLLAHYVRLRILKKRARNTDNLEDIIQALDTGAMTFEEAGALLEDKALDKIGRHRLISYHAPPKPSTGPTWPTMPPPLGQIVNEQELPPGVGTIRL